MKVGHYLWLNADLKSVSGSLIGLADLLDFKLWRVD